MVLCLNGIIEVLDLKMPTNDNYLDNIYPDFLLLSHILCILIFSIAANRMQYVRHVWATIAPLTL